MARFCVVCVDGPAAGWRYVTSMAPAQQLRLVPSHSQLGEWLVVREDRPGVVVYEHKIEIPGDDMVFAHYRLTDGSWFALQDTCAHWVRLFNRLDAAITRHEARKAEFHDEEDEALWAAHERVMRDVVRGRDR